MKTSIQFASLTAFAAASIIGGVASAATTVVGPGNLENWQIYTTDNVTYVPGTGTGTADFVNGPATPPLGTGSAHLQTGPGQGDGGALLRSTGFAGTALSSISALSYSTSVTSNNGQQAPYMTVYLDTTGLTGVVDDRVIFEPSYSAADAGNANPYTTQAEVATGSWQNWDVRHGMVYDDNGTGNPGSGAISWDAFNAAYPNATIVNAVDGLGGLRFTMGYASPGDDMNANVDDFSITTNGVTSTYDFESVTPEPASLGLITVTAAGLLMRRRRRQLA